MKRFLTLMIIPHSDDRVREFNLGAPLLWAGGVAVLMFLAVASYFAYGYYARQGAETAYAGLTTENKELENQLSSLRDRMTGLSDRVDALRSADTRMRAFTRTTELNVPDPSAPESDSHASGASGYASLDRLNHDAERLAAGYDSLFKAVQSAGTSSRQIPSIFPVRGEGWYASHFGYRTDPITGQRSFNNGIDIAGRKGTPIVATADGTIESALHHNRLGHMVVIDHGNGIRSVYAHMEDHGLVKKGQTIRRGETVGKMDRSGRTTAVNLYYAVIRDNKAQDPRDYIFDDRARRSLF